MFSTASSSTNANAHYRNHTFSSSSLISKFQQLNCKRYSLALTRANTDIFLTSNYSKMFNKNHIRSKIKFRRQTIVGVSNSNLDDSVLDESITNFKLESSIAKSIETLSLGNDNYKRKNSATNLDATTNSTGSFTGSFTGNLKRSSIFISNSNTDSYQKKTPAMHNSSNGPRRKNSLKLNKENENNANNSKYAITASLSYDAQCAMFKAYEDLLYQEIKCVYPDLDQLMSNYNVIRQLNHISNQNDPSPSPSPSPSPNNLNKDKAELRKTKISGYIQAGIKILDLVRKMNKDNNNANSNKNSNETSPSVVSFSLSNNQANNHFKRRSSVLLGKKQSLLNNNINNTTSTSGIITVIDEETSDRSDPKSGAEIRLDEKDPIIMFMSDYDYKEKTKKKKKHHHNDKEDELSGAGLKAKPVRNFKIIDDDIDINTLNPSEDVEALVDMLDPEGPQIADMDEYEKLKLLQKSEMKSNENQNKWVKLDMFDDEEKRTEEQNDNSSSFRKRTTEKSGNKQLNSDDFKYINQNDDDEDDDLDMIARRRRDSDDLDVPRRKNINDDLSPVRRRPKHEDDDLSPVRQRKPREKSPSREIDLSPVRRKSKKAGQEEDLSPVRSKKKHEKSKEKDLSPVRRVKEEEEEEVDETKVRVRKTTKEEEMKKARKEEKLAKYMEWGKGLVQKKERDEKLAFDVYEADKPLARYKDDKDLERILKEQEREEDPMLEYMRSSKAGDILEDGTVSSAKAVKQKYRGPPPPPNRYNILPGPRWDGVDRSNGFEKKYYESITARKAREQEAYKWSTEDM